MTYARNPGALSGVDCAAVVRAINKGTPYASIAKRHGCSITMVHNIGRVHGAKPRQQKIDRDRVAKILEACRAGEKYHDIAQRFDVSWSSVQRLASNVGLRRVQPVALSGYALEVAHANGRSAKSIAAELRVSPKVVCRRLRQRGVDLSKWTRKVTDDQVRGCVFAGMTGKQAAKKLGVKAGGTWYQRWRRIVGEVANRGAVSA